MANANRGAQNDGLLNTNFGMAGEEGSDMSAAVSAFEAELAGAAGEQLENDGEGQDTGPDEGEQQGPQDELPPDEDDSEDAPEGEEDEESEDDGDGEDSDEDDEDDESEEDEDDGPAPTIDPDTKVRVKVDGEEIEVPFSELQSGYSRTQDYTRKTEEVAQQRKAVENERQQVLQQQQQWSENLAQLGQRLQASLSGRTEAEWQQLRAEDEITYYQERERERGMEQRLAAIQQEQQRVAQEQQQARQTQYQQAVQDEREKLRQAIPEWSDEATAKRDIQEMVEYGKSIGFSEQEVNSIVDHRALKVLRDAAKMQALQSSRDTGAAKSKVKKRAKPLKAGAAAAKPTKASKARKAQQRHTKEHSVKSAAALIENMLD